MEKDDHAVEAEGVVQPLTEGTMEFVPELVAVQPGSRTTPTDPCTHSRAIDEVLTRNKKRTGKVRCLECGAIFEDPYMGRM